MYVVTVAIPLLPMSDIGEGLMKMAVGPQRGTFTFAITVEGPLISIKMDNKHRAFAQVRT